MVRHGRIELAVHLVRGPRDDGDAGGAAGLPLLMLHGLGERTPSTVTGPLARWRGPVHGLDFSGHGASTVPVGGGYTSEILLADASVALDEVGPATVSGRGIGAWIALLLAGARPDLVRGAILLDGPGITGGGTEPGSPWIVEASPAQAGLAGPVAESSAGTRGAGSPDPFALVELSRDVRPADYATTFVRFALEGSDLAEPIAVAAVARPVWLTAVVAEPGVAVGSIADAVALYDTVG